MFGVSTNRIIIEAKKPFFSPRMPLENKDVFLVHADSLILVMAGCNSGLFGPKKMMKAELLR